MKADPSPQQSATTREESRRPLHRWLLFLLLLVAGMGSLVLRGTVGSAAGVAQQSPLSSPLETPSALPTPTPTSPLPPTNTPSASLADWPTPTPTPYPSAVTNALAFVADELDLEEDQLLFFYRQPIIDPETGEQRTAVQVLDGASGALHWVLVDAGGEVRFPPDLSTEARMAVAEREDLNADEFQMLGTNYQPYLFSQQLIFVGRLLHTAEYERYTVLLDLAGQPVDEAELQEAETAAQADFCGAIEADLCRLVRLDVIEPDGEGAHSVSILVESDEALADVTERLAEEEIEFDQEQQEITALVPADLVADLGQSEGVAAIAAYTPDRVVPLDTNLSLAVSEIDRTLSLDLVSARRYPFFNYSVAASLARLPITATEPMTLAVTIDGIHRPAGGPEVEGPATAQLELGDDLAGQYELTLDYTDEEQDLAFQDRYLLLVQPDRVVLRPTDNEFTWPRYSGWLRLPKDAIWFVVQSQQTNLQGEPFDVTEEEFAEKAEAFYAGLADLGAQPLALRAGVYTHRSFVPPWESWQIPSGEMVQIPVADDRSFLFKWPDIRYFTYTGDREAVVDLIDEHCVDEVWITGYTESGDVLEVCQP